MFTKAKDGTASVDVANVPGADGVAANEAAAEAATAKTAAKEAIANANRLDKIAKDLLKKTPATKPTPPGSKRKGAAAPVVSRKRMSSDPAKTARPPKRNPGPFFDTSLADQHPSKAVVVDASLNKGYTRCVITLLFPSLF